MISAETLYADKNNLKIARNEWVTSGVEETRPLGTRGELKFFERLLKEGFEVYTPIFDFGIDCIVRTKTGRFREVQVKTRDSSTKSGRDFDVKQFKPRENYFIVCHFADTDDFWIVPSEIFLENVINKEEEDAKIPWRVHLSDKLMNEWKMYKNNFDQLRHE